MATVTVSRDELRVTIPAFEALQALQRSFSVPISRVRGAKSLANQINNAIAH